jgi:hypothetical protein
MARCDVCGKELSYGDYQWAKRCTNRYGRVPPHLLRLLQRFVLSHLLLPSRVGRIERGVLKSCLSVTRLPSP